MKARLPSLLRNRALVALMAGHFTNDMMAGSLPIFYPLLKQRFHLDNAQIGLVTLVFTAAGSLAQPVFGGIIDRTARRWYAPAALVWMAGFVALWGYAPSYAAFLAVAALAGLGSAAFHPVAVTGAVALASERQRNTAASLFTVGGTTGYALGPLITVGVLAALGIRGTPVFLLPGLLIAWVLYRAMLHVDRQRQRHRAHGASNPSVTHWTDLARVIVVVMLRSWVFLSLLQFVPVWYDELGYDRAFYGALSTIIILAGVVGTLTGGALADRIGGKVVIASTLAGCAPAVLLFAGFPGTIALLTGAVFGFLSDASLSVTLVAAQRLLPGRPGIASGIILGLGFVTGGLGVPMTGALADRVGIGQALMMLSVLSISAALLALTIPRRAFGRSDELHRPSDAAERAPLQSGPAVPAMETER